MRISPGYPLGIRSLRGAVTAALSVVVVGGCGASDPSFSSEFCTLGGRLTVNRTLDDCAQYRVTEPVFVEGGAILTIPAGRELTMDAGAALIVGADSEGSIVARGSLGLPIVLSGTLDIQGEPAPWGGVFFLGGTAAGSQLTHVHLQGGGIIESAFVACLSVTDVTEGHLALNSVAVEGCQGIALSVRSGRLAPSEDLRVVGARVGLAVAPANAVDVASTQLVDVAENVVFGSTIETDTTLPALGTPWTISGDIAVDGRGSPTLRLEPGVVARFQPDRWLSVGLERGGRLVAEGTPAAPVVLESAASGDASAWHGIVLGPAADGLRLTRTVVADGGADGLGVRGCVSLGVGPTAELTIVDSRFERCAQAGVGATETADPVFTEFARNTFVGSATGVSLPPRAATSVDASQRYEDTPHNTMAGGVLETDAVWTAHAVPWRLDGDLQVRGKGAPTLELSPGLRVEVAADRRIEVGSLEAGGLHARGTQDAPIVLTSQDAAPWRGIVFGAELTPRSVLEHVRVENAGAEGPNVRGCLTLLSAQPDRLAVSRCELVNCGAAAVYAGEDGVTLEAFEDNVLIDSQEGLVLAPSAVASVGHDNVFEAVERNVIVGGTLATSATWRPLAVPWLVRDTVRIAGESAPVLTLPAGLTLQFGVAASLRVGDLAPGGLVAEGEEGAPVHLTAEAKRVEPGAWGGVVLGPQAAGTRLTYVRLGSAGGDVEGIRGGLTLVGTADRVSVENSTFEANAQADLYLDCTSEPKLVGNRFTSAIGLVRDPDCQ